MNALRIRKRLDVPIPELPELAPLVGRTVEIIVLDESPGAATGGGFYDRPSANALAAAQGVGAVVSIDQLRSAEPDAGESMDGFDDAVGRWRQEPWRGGGG